MTGLLRAWRAGAALTAAVVGAALAPLGAAAGTLSPELQELARAGTADPVEVVVLLAPQLGGAVAREVRVGSAVRVRQLTEQISAGRRLNLPDSGPLTESEEHAYARRWAGHGAVVSGEDVRQLKEELDALGAANSAEIVARLRTAVTPSQDELVAFVLSIGGEVRGRLAAVNVMLVELPAASLWELAEHRLVVAVEENLPGGPDLDYQRISLGVETFWDDSPTIDGWPWDVASIDSGVDHTHPDLSSHTFIKNYASYEDGHGTSSTSIYASTDEEYRGMAFGLDAIFVDNAGEEWETMEAFDWVLGYLTENAEVFNYSWGNGTADTVDYGGIEAFFDAVVSTYDVVIAKSAGNNGWGTTTINRPSGAHNVLTVADMWDWNTEERNDDTIWGTSSTGPTLNGRRKPDLTAPGAFTRCPCPGDDPDGNMCQFGGTSAAAPHVGAGALLLRDLGVSDSMAIRAILINTADAWTCNYTETTDDDGQVTGSRWDKRFGWGYLDLWEAWFNGGDYFLDSVREHPNPVWFDFFAGQMYMGEKATLVWNKRVEANGEDYPVTEYDLTNLDLRLYDELDSSGPEDADFDVDDNVHQVAALESGFKVVTVYAWDMNIDGLSEEPYALATEENFSKMNGPDLSEVTVNGLGTTCGEAFWISAHVTNDGDLWAHGVEVEVELPPLGWSLVSGDNPTAVGSLADGSTATVLWKVQPPDGAYGWYPFYIWPTTDSYGITQSWRVQQLVEVRQAPANDTCETADFIPLSPGTVTMSGDSTAACNDYDVAGACTGYDSDGRDVVYRLHLTEQTRVCVTMTPDFTFDPVLYLVADCGAPGDCLAGSDAIGYGVAESLCATVDPEPGGQDFYIVADAYGANTGGGFELEVSLSPGLIFSNGFESGDLSGW